MTFRLCKRILGIGLLAVGSIGYTIARAELAVAPIFGDHMVLQRGAPAPVFGTADPYAQMTVEFDGQRVVAVADANGRWQATLAPMEARTPSTLSVFGDGAWVAFSGVQVGEVWLCSGQSNMGYPLVNANDSGPAIAEAAGHNIRLFRMTAGNGPATASWQASNPDTAGGFSAVCYWMGLELAHWFGDVPVGLIQATHDGTAIERWQHSAGGVGDDYDAMVRAIQPYGVKGVLWYQGESNGGDAGYAAKLASMIGEWRADWGQDYLPFGIVQLAYRSGWNVARNAQLVVADSVEDSFLVVIRDLPGGALHPPDKQAVGIRSAIGARGLVYGEDIVWSGPIRDVPNSFVESGIVVLAWKHLGGGLYTDDGLPPGEFLLAGANGRFKPASAAIVGDMVEVWSSAVPDPVKVQYAYRSVGNLYNFADVLSGDGGQFIVGLKASEFEISLAGDVGNQPPVARFTHSTSGLSVGLDGSSSADSDGTLTAFHWNLGDGTSVEGAAVVEHVYAGAGSYTIVLTVTDDDGATGQAAQTVTVTDDGGTATSMHVSSLAAFAEGAGRGAKHGVAEAIVRDDLDGRVAGALVTVQFSGAFAEVVSGWTDANGYVRLVTVGEQRGSVVVNACVVDLQGALDYVPNATDCGP
jgi:sialate O-acetylesterase